MTEAMLDTINHVMREANITIDRVKILDYELDRIYLAVDGEENNYNIRIWNIDDQAIRYSLFYFDQDNTEEILKSRYYIYA